MNRYKSISKEGSRIKTSTLSGLKRLLRKNKLKGGTFTCITPSGKTHNWKATNELYSGKGYSGKPMKKTGKRKRMPYSVFNVKLQLLNVA